MSAAFMVESTSAMKINKGVDNSAYSVDEIELTEQQNGIQNEQTREETPAVNMEPETSGTNPEVYESKGDDEPPFITDNVQQNENTTVSHETNTLEDKIEVIEETEPSQTTQNGNQNIDSVTILSETKTLPENCMNYSEKPISNGAGTFVEQNDNFVNEFKDYPKEELQETITTKNTKRYELERWNKHKSCCFIFFWILFFVWVGCYYVYSIEYFQKKIYDNK